MFTSGITRFARDASLPLHAHNCEELVTVLEGEANFEDDAGACDLSVGDTVFVPAGIAHRFANRGAGELRILWIYGSTTPTRTIVATDETFPVGQEPRL